MHRLIVFILVGCLPFLAGCRGNDKAAEQYAGKLSVVLQSYQDQVNKKIKAEQDAYTNLAAIFAQAHDADAIESLQYERDERAEQFTDDLLTRDPKSPITLSEVHAQLRGYGEVDFERSQPIYQQEASASSQHLADLEDLELESQKIEALLSALNDLAKPRSQAQQLRQLTQFAEQVNTEFNRLLCEDLAKGSADLTKRIAALKKTGEGLAKLPEDTDAKKADKDKKIAANKQETNRLQDQLDLITAEQKRKNCS